MTKKNKHANNKSKTSWGTKALITCLLVTGNALSVKAACPTNDALTTCFNDVMGTAGFDFAINSEKTILKTTAVLGCVDNKPTLALDGKCLTYQADSTDRLQAWIGSVSQASSGFCAENGVAGLPVKITSGDCQKNTTSSSLTTVTTTSMTNQYSTKMQSPSTTSDADTTNRVTTDITEQNTSKDKPTNADTTHMQHETAPVSEMGSTPPSASPKAPEPEAVLSVGSIVAIATGAVLAAVSCIAGGVYFLRKKSGISSAPDTVQDAIEKGTALADAQPRPATRTDNYGPAPAQPSVQYSGLDKDCNQVPSR